MHSQLLHILIIYVVDQRKPILEHEPQGQYWAGRTPRPNNSPPNMAAANFVVITNGEGCELNGTAVAAVFIDQRSV